MEIATVSEKPNIEITDRKTARELSCLVLKRLCVLKFINRFEYPLS